jgi:hypothetical protein
MHMVCCHASEAQRVAVFRRLLRLCSPRSGWPERCQHGFKYQRIRMRPPRVSAFTDTAVATRTANPWSSDRRATLNAAQQYTGANRARDRSARQHTWKYITPTCILDLGQIEFEEYWLRQLQCANAITPGNGKANACQWGKQHLMATDRGAAVDSSSWHKRHASTCWQLGMRIGVYLLIPARSASSRNRE